MAIFDEKKMEQKPVYPTKKTPSYADWVLFNMGKELEESIPSGLTVDQEVIAGSENAVSGGAVKTYVDTEVAGVNEVPVSTSADENKVLTVDSNGEPNWATPSTPQITVDQTVIAGSTNPVSGGGVKTYVDSEIGNVKQVPVAVVGGKVLTSVTGGEPEWDDISNLTEQTVIAGNLEPVSGAAVKNYVDTEVSGINEVPASTVSDEDKVLSVNHQGVSQWVYLEDITDELPGSTSFDAGKVLTVNSSGNAEWQTPSTPQITVDQSVIAGSTNPVSGGGVKTYVDSEIELVNEVPGSIVADAGKVLTVNSSGNAEWQTPSSGVTRHTYNTFGELVADIIAHPNSVITRSRPCIRYVVEGSNVTIYTFTISGSSSMQIESYNSSTITSSDTSTTLTCSGVSKVITTSISSQSSSITLNISDISLYY